MIDKFNKLGASHDLFTVDEEIMLSTVSMISCLCDDVDEGTQFLSLQSL